MCQSNSAAPKPKAFRNLSLMNRFCGMLLAAVLLACLARCGGNGTPAPPPPPPGAPAILFRSFRALDGSNAGSANNTENIWGINADGTGATPLTKLTAAVVSFDPAWSPDGTVIAFASNRAPGGGDNHNQTFLPDIWAMKTDGSGLIQLFNSGPIPVSSSTNPMWSPDGRKLMFDLECCGLNAGPGVAVMNADGTNVTKLATSFAHNGPSPDSWSHDGSKLLFDSPLVLNGSGGFNTNQTSNVWIMNADGSTQTPLTKLTAVNADCAGAMLSPDGSKIAFVSARAFDGSDAANASATLNIWVENIDGTGAKPLTQLLSVGAGSTAPVWSPDGTKLAFVFTRALNGSDAANTNTTANIWIMNADGTGAAALTKLTASGANSSSPAWKPNSSILAFDSRRALDGSDAANAASNIWVVNADGSGATALTKLSVVGADSVQPSWRP